MRDRETCQGKSNDDEDLASMDMLCVAFFLVLIVVTVLAMVML